MNQLFLESIRAQREYIHLLENFDQASRRQKPLPMLATGLGENALCVFLPALTEDLRDRAQRSVLLVLPDEKEIRKLSGVFAQYGICCAHYPQRDFMFYHMTASREFEHERLGVLHGLVSGELDAVLTTPQALLQYTMPPEVLRSNTLTLRFGEEYAPQQLCRFLSDAGYRRVELVDGKCQYSVRGGILDLFPPAMENPVRIEFFGDEIDQMGIFDPMTQRKIEQIDRCEITPAREILLSAQSKEKLCRMVTAQLKKAAGEKARESLAEELEMLRGDGDCTFLDKYISVIYEKPVCLLDYFVTGEHAAPVIVCDTDRCGESLQGHDFRHTEQARTLIEEGLVPGKYAVYSKGKSDFDAVLGALPAVLVNTFAGGADRKLSGIFSFQAKQTVSYADQIPLLLEDLQHYIAQKYRIVLLTPNRNSQQQMQQTLFAENIPSTQKLPGSIMELTPGVPLLTEGVRTEGYELPGTHFVVLSLYPAESAYARALRQSGTGRRKKKSAAEKIASYNDLTVGDYVVHEAHGIGQYLGIQSITSSGGITRDYIKIRYAGTDELFIPCDQLDRISKYIGPRAAGEDSGVKLSKMGGAEWKRAKTRARAATKEMAHELIQLYAARSRTPGFAFAKDDPMQRDFESTFEFEETQAQLQAAEEIKRDMEKPVPMDRLLCGDVGYGKTEVALRAAFKAVLSGKQVAILVPTTLLALQHYQTILARMRGFPVTAELLSRMRAPARQQEILRRVRRGEIDILVGTHRMVSADVTFRDLGLVIIDEEQRFGVKQKERLKELSKNVDVLTLTATPIPRTLNMAMSGIRDMSILDEAPGDRVPIQTFVLEYDQAILTDAVRQEMRRGGQVFWLHNRVEDIDAVAAMLRQSIPDVRVVCAHGKMDKEELNRIWQMMVNGEIDVLVSTTIIETGVDVPNANTLIMERADKMGLAQLHQIRGRVGRSGRRAYAYLTYPRSSVLTEVSRKRLNAIREFTEFGAGFKIAMRDLEIRGAGNLLGAQQHGHMDAVGYDLYVKLLNEAILEEKGEAVPQKTECVISLSVDATLPQSYISSSAQRIDVYKKIAAVESRADYDDVYDELCDRFGTPPVQTENLLGISYLRALAQNAGITRIEDKNGWVALYVAQLDFAAWSTLGDRYEQEKQRRRIRLIAGEKPYLQCRLPGKIVPALYTMLEELETIRKENKDASGGNA